MPTRNLEIAKQLTRHLLLNGLPVAGQTTQWVLPQPSASRAASVEGVISRRKARER